MNKKNNFAIKAAICPQCNTVIDLRKQDWTIRTLQCPTCHEEVEPTTNCSRLEQAFTVESKKITPAYFRNAIRRKSDREHIGFVNEETGKLDFAFMAAIYGFAPLELRQLADLVEETLEKGGKP